MKRTTKNYRYFFITILSAILLLISCGGEPLFTDLGDNTLEVKLKLTYASNDPNNWSFPGVGSVEDDSINVYPSLADDNAPTEFKMDIAEIRLDGDRFANYRQEVVVSLDNGASTSITNDSGITLINDDPKPNKTYDTVELYIRKMLFNQATRYPANTGFAPENNEVIFFEEDVVGFDFNQLQPNSYYDSLQNDEQEINRVFPLEIPIVGGFRFDRDKKQVLEIRLVVNNFIELYEYEDFDRGEYYIVHYYGLADWLRDVQPNETDVGGNVHAVARAYAIGDTGSIVGDSDVSGGAGDYYIIAIPSTAGFTQSDCEFDGTPIRGATGYDMPISPSDPGDDYIQPKLDHYLKLEQFKIDWEATGQGGGVGSQSGYENEWDNYNSPRENFRIAPIAAFVTGDVLAATQNYTLENVPVGTYTLWRASPPAFGSLFGAGDFVDQIGSVIVTAGSSTTVNFP